jgi:hypothetical protein
LRKAHNADKKKDETVIYWLEPQTIETVTLSIEETKNDLTTITSIKVRIKTFLILRYHILLQF